MACFASHDHHEQLTENRLSLICRHFCVSVAAIAAGALLAACGTASNHHHSTSIKRVHAKTSSGSGTVRVLAIPSISASRAETDAENRVGSCIEGFYGNEGYNNITPSYLGNGLVKFQADGDSNPDGSVTVRVNPDGSVQDNRTLRSMGCKPGSYMPANDPNYDPTPSPAPPATYDWTCSLAPVGVDITVTATGNEPVRANTLGIETETAIYFVDGNVMYQWGPGSYGIATSYVIEPGQTWSVWVPVPVVDNSARQTVSCQVVAQ